jgi:hypothetical protein
MNAFSSLAVKVVREVKHKLYVYATFKTPIVQSHRTRADPQLTFTMNADSSCLHPAALVVVVRHGERLDYVDRDHRNSNWVQQAKDRPELGHVPWVLGDDVE